MAIDRGGIENESVKDKIFSLIDQLAEKLGTTGEALWKITVKQAYVSAIYSLLKVAIVIICLPILLKFTENHYNSFILSSEGVSMIAVIISTIWVGYAIIVYETFNRHIGNFIDGMFNPEYWALTDITNKINELR